MMRGASVEALGELGVALGRVRTQADAAVVGEQLFGAADVLRTEVALRRVLTDAAVEEDAKAGLATSVFAESVSQDTMTLLADAVRRRWTRGLDLPDALTQVAVQALVRSEGVKAARMTDELFAVAQLVESDAGLRSALGDPARAADDRSALLAGLVDDKVLPATAQLVRHAVGSDAGPVIAVLARYQKLVAAAQDEMVAVVHSARELTESEQNRISAALSKQYATTVHLHLVLDPDLVGGLKVEIGDDVIDGSVSARLDDARRKIAG